VQTALTLGLVVLGPVLAVATFLAMGPFNQDAASPVLRLILLADLIYVLAIAALVLVRVMRLVADRRSRSAGSRLHLRLSGVFMLIALIPTVLVAVFAVLSINIGLEGWFSQRVRSVVGSSLDAAEAYEAVQRDDLAEDASLNHNDGRAARQAWLDGEIEAWTSARPAAEVLAVMTAADVPASKIYDIRDIVADAHYQARGMIREIELGEGETLKVPGVVPKLSATPGDFDGGGPALGAHTDEVLRELGFDDVRIAQLRERGII